MSAKRSFEGLLLAVFFILLAVTVAGGFLIREWRPAVASEHGQGVDSMITYLLFVTGAVFLLGHGVLAIFIWRYRRREPVAGAPTSERPPYRPPSLKTEWLWAIVPALAISVVAEVGGVVLGFPVWEKLTGAAPEGAVAVDVAGKQFEWLVRYPGKDGTFGRVKPELIDDASNPIGLDEEDAAAKDDILLRGRLVIPMSRPVFVTIRSHDVLHSFAVPEFRIKQDAVPGFSSHTQFVAEKAGKYEIACAELCGMGHYRMQGWVEVLPKEEFERWLEKQVGWFE